MPSRNMASFTTQDGFSIFHDIVYENKLTSAFHYFQWSNMDMPNHWPGLFPEHGNYLVSTLEYTHNSRVIDIHLVLYFRYFFELHTKQYHRLDYFITFINVKKIFKLHHINWNWLHLLSPRSNVKFNNIRTILGTLELCTCMAVLQ